MAIKLPGPDRPGVVARPKVPRVRVPKAARKPKKPKKPKNIVYRTPKPPSGNRPLGGVAPVAGSSFAPNLAAGAAQAKPQPLSMLDTWRQMGLTNEASLYEQMKNEGKAHQAYVTDKVMPWLSNSLNLLNAYNTDAQNTLLGGIQGASGAYGVSAALTPMNVASNAPGGAVVGPNSYLTDAGRQQALGTGNVATALANSQAALNKMQPVTLSQGYINALADRAAGLPLIYTKRLNEYAANVNQFIAEAQAGAAEAAADQARWEAEFTEKNRHNRVSEATSALNAQTNAAFQAARLGLSADDQAFDQSQALAGQSGEVPYGFVRLPNGDIVRDPSVPSASSASGGGKKSTKGTYTPNELKKQGFVGGWAVKPKGKVGASAVRATNGRWYAKPGKASTPTTGDAPENLRQELDKWYFGKVDGKYDPPAATRRVGNWILSRKKRFTRKDGTVNFDAIASLLVGVIGGSTIPAGVRDFLKAYIVNGRWR